MVGMAASPTARPHPTTKSRSSAPASPGIGTAIKLTEKGIDDFAIVEAGDGVGGTWYWNTYPGVAVDIPSPSYQFSFEQMSDWSRLYAPGNELKAYAEHLVDKYGVRPYVRFNSKVTSAVFDEDAHHLAPRNRGRATRSPPAT